jgi:MerR family transcriptional regulator, light-induced transcriptional regulator
VHVKDSGRGLYKMNTVSERTGFSPALLRAWERRHGLLVPERTAGGHRLYTDDDLRVLARVRDLLSSGRAIGEIASMGRETLLQETVSRTHPEPSELTSELEGWSQALVQSAVKVDQRGAREALDRAFGVLSPEAALEQVVFPALVTIGELWADGRCTVSGEHLLSSMIVGRLLRLLEAANPSSATGAKPAICACLPDERHEIGALVTAFNLAKHHYRIVYLGPALPFEDLERTCHILAPEVICLSVSRPSLLQTHTPRLIELVRRLPPATRVLLGGRGVKGCDRSLLAAGVSVLDGDLPVDESLRAGLTRKRKKAGKPKR